MCSQTQGLTAHAGDAENRALPRDLLKDHEVDPFAIPNRHLIRVVFPRRPLEFVRSFGVEPPDNLLDRNRFPPLRISCLKPCSQLLLPFNFLEFEFRPFIRLCHGYLLTLKNDQLTQSPAFTGIF